MLAQDQTTFRFQERYLWVAYTWDTFKHLLSERHSSLWKWLYPQCKRRAKFNVDWYLFINANYITLNQALSYAVLLHSLVLCQNQLRGFLVLPWLLASLLAPWLARLSKQVLMHWNTTWTKVLVQICNSAMCWKQMLTQAMQCEQKLLKASMDMVAWILSASKCQFWCCLCLSWLHRRSISVTGFILNLISTKSQLLELLGQGLGFGLGPILTMVWA